MNDIKSGIKNEISQLNSSTISKKCHSFKGLHSEVQGKKFCCCQLYVVSLLIFEFTHIIDNFNDRELI